MDCGHLVVEITQGTFLCFVSKCCWRSHAAVENMAGQNGCLHGRDPIHSVPWTIPEIHDFYCVVWKYTVSSNKQTVLHHRDQQALQKFLWRFIFSPLLSPALRCHVTTTFFLRGRRVNGSERVKGEHLLSKQQEKSLWFVSMEKQRFFMPFCFVFTRITKEDR